MRHDPLIQQVVAYWEALRAGRPAPLRAEVDPRGIETALDRVFLAERIAPGIGRIRLAGMCLNDVLGMEVRGMPLTALIAPEDREAFANTLERVYAGGRRADIRLRGMRGPGKPEFEAELALLPLANDRAASGLVLGCLATSGTIGRAPRRFAVTSAELIDFAVTAPATVVPNLPPRRPARSEPAGADTVGPPYKGLSEAPAVFVPSRRQPDLRLVTTDD